MTAYEMISINEILDDTCFQSIDEDAACDDETLVEALLERIGPYSQITQIKVYSRTLVMFSG